MALDRRVTMLVSVPLMIEYEAVLTRPEQLRETGLTADETRTVLDAVAAVIEPVQLRFLWRLTMKDPADEMVLETAVNRQADCAVTFNVRHLADAVARFGMRVGDVWRRIQGARDEEK
jgi:predicted nucleic acid-binding protein